MKEEKYNATWGINCPRCGGLKVKMFNLEGDVACSECKGIYNRRPESAYYHPGLKGEETTVNSRCAK